MQDVNDIPVFGSRVDGCPYVIRPSAYALVLDARGAVAIVRTPRGCYLPGGGVAAEESPEQAIEREAIEECGLVLRPRRILAEAIEIVYSARENTCFEKRSTFIKADLTGLTSSLEEDHLLVWMDIEEAIESVTSESHRWALRRLAASSSLHMPR